MMSHIYWSNCWLDFDKPKPRFVSRSKLPNIVKLSDWSVSYAHWVFYTDHTTEGTVLGCDKLLIAAGVGKPLRLVWLNIAHFVKRGVLIIAVGFVGQLCPQVLSARSLGHGVHNSKAVCRGPANENMLLSETLAKPRIFTWWDIQNAPDVDEWMSHLAKRS